MRRGPRFLVLAVCFFLALSGAGAVWFHDSERAARPPGNSVGTANGAAIHAIVLDDLHAHPRSLAEWSGRPVLVNFWATWCPPCIEELPLLARTSQSASNNLQIVGIAVDRRENVERFVKRQPIPYPVLISETGGVAISKSMGNRLGVMPFSALLSANGDVLVTYPGPLNADKIAQMQALSAK
jgi:thiol-disulfide isomerase/thioredoxin